MGMQKCVGEQAMVDPKLTLASIQCLIIESIFNFIRIKACSKFCNIDNFVEN